MYYKRNEIPALEENAYRAFGDRKEAVLKAVDKANARLAKRGYSEQVGITIVREFFVESKQITGQWIPKFDFTLEGPTFAEGQWRFVGVIDHLPTKCGNDYANIVRSFDPKAISKTGKNWFAHGPECVHCGLDRRRNQTVLVEKDGEVIQVGKTCLEAYTQCPAGIMVLNEIEKITRASNGGGTAWVYNVRDIVACAVKVSEGATRYDKGDVSERSTKWDTFACLERTKTLDGEYMWEWPNENDFAMADTIMGWVADTFEYSNSYQANVLSLFTADYVLAKHVGILASVIGSWVREKRERAVKATKTNEWVSKVGDTFEGALTLVRKPGFDTQYGYMTIYTFEDASGNVLIWKTSSTIYNGEYEIGAGDVVTLKGKVKAHDLYKGLKQTVLTRCKVTVFSSEEKVA